MREKWVLLVEDEPLVRDVLFHNLVAEGYSVDAVASVAAACECLAERWYAVAIIDWRLPDGEGTLVADRAANLGAKTFIMSGYLFQMPGGRSDRHEILMKPIRPSEILAVVERAIGKAGATG